MSRLGSLTIKFIDIMIGVVLGLGFQWWGSLQEPWQFAAFIFVYFDLVDYWVDYSASLKKLPPRRELGMLLDVAVVFTMFLYIYATQLPLMYFLLAFIGFRLVDILCLLRAKAENRPTPHEAKFLRAWMVNNTVEALYTAGLLLVIGNFSPAVLLGVFIVLRLATRVWASLQYKKVYFS